MRRLLFGILMTTAPAMANPYNSFNYGSIWSNYDIAEELDRLRKKPQESLLNAHRWSSSKPGQHGACLNQFKNYYKDGVLQMNIALGYQDAPSTGAAMDPEIYNALLGAMTRSCWGDSLVCGFEITRQSGGVTHLQKTIRNTAVQGLPSKLKVRVILARSAWSSRDRENFAGPNPRPEQVRYSQAAENVFFGGLGEPGRGVPTCDVCVYLGHARDGGGPDFRPVPFAWRKPEGGPVYSYYQANKTNYRRMMRAISNSKHSSSQLLAVLGCSSYDHFYKTNRRTCIDRTPSCKRVSLKDFENRFGFLLTEELSWPQNVPAYMGILLDGVLGLKCASSWRDNFARLRSLPKFPEAYRLQGNFMRVSAPAPAPAPVTPAPAPATEI